MMVPPNILMEERSNLQCLSADPELAISPVGKGDEVAILHTSQYLDLAYCIMVFLCTPDIYAFRAIKADSYLCDF